MDLLNFYQKIRLTVNIHEIISRFIKIQKRGKEYTGLCPFHKERTGSFSVNLDKKFYYCFGCKAHGDVISFFAQINLIKYHEAALKLAKEYNIDLPQNKLYVETNERYFDSDIIIKFFQSQINEDVSSYLASRGVTQDLIDAFEIGYAPATYICKEFFAQKNIKKEHLLQIGVVSSKNTEEISYIFNNRIMFPIRDLNNQLVGFGGRTFLTRKNIPKYLNSPETNYFKKKEILYLENIALTEARKRGFLLLVEGYLDSIILHKMGFKSTAAILGTSFSQEHYNKIFRYTKELIICFDMDQAGFQAKKKLIELVLPQITPDKKITFINLPLKSDPGDLINFPNQDVFHLLIKQRVSLSQMIWDIEYHKSKISSPEDKAFLQFRLLKYCQLIQNSLIRNNFKYFFNSMSWKIFHKFSAISSKNYITKILDFKKYEELEFLDKIILALVFYNKEFLQNAIYFNKFQEINFCQNILNDFKTLICEEFIKNHEINLEKYFTDTNHSTYKNLIMILSEIRNRECVVLFSKIKQNNLNIYFDFLIKKRYLILLKQEYYKIIENNAVSLDKKILPYIEEIQKLNFEINSFNEKI